jgi:hypothetical protein
METTNIQQFDTRPNTKSLTITKLDKHCILGCKELSDYFDSIGIKFYHIDNASAFFNCNDRWCKVRTIDTSKRPISMSAYMSMLTNN